MKYKLKYHSIFLAIAILGASTQIGFKFAYGIAFADNFSSVSETTPSFAGYLAYFCARIEPFLLLFLSGFTIYAPFVGGVACCYIGALSGLYAYTFVLSGYGTVLVSISALLGLSCMVLCAHLSVAASYHRNSLSVCAPSVSAFIKSKNTKTYFVSFVTVCAILIPVISALYLYSIYFPARSH